MRAHARFRAPEGALYELVHGDLIGRLGCAAMPLDDGRVSEAHAMVSLREQELRLVALRGGFAVDGRPVSEIALRAGMEIVLAQGLSIEVEDVYLPSVVLGVESARIPRQVLPSVCSILERPEPRLLTGYAERGGAWIWYTGDAWRLRLGNEPPRALLAGDTFMVGDERLHAIDIPLAAAGLAPTRPHGGVATPLRILANFDTVHLFRNEVVAAVLGGIPARIISELVALGGPAHWTVLTGLLWPQEPDPDVVRSRLDVNLSRLRRKLREVRIRSDLVHTDGAGRIELLLYPDDVVEDRT